MDEAAMAAMAETLAATGEYRLLRRLDLDRAFANVVPSRGDDAVALVLDVETEGTDPDKHRIVELAVRRFRHDAAGVIVDVDPPRVWLEDPGRPLDPAIAALTGLADADLAGRAIDEDEAVALIRSATVRIAHNAGFDRRFVERRLPAVAGLPWACTMREIDWRARDVDGGRSLGWLLAQAGHFNARHAAGADVDATIQLLRHRSRDGHTALSEMLDRAARPTWLVQAVGAAFDRRAILKARGYAWSSDRKTWRREVEDGLREPEEAWLAGHVYAREHDPRADGPRVERVTWATRHA